MTQINYLDIIEQLLPASIQDIKEAVDLVNETWIGYNFINIPFWWYKKDIELRIDLAFTMLLKSYELNDFKNKDWSFNVKKLTNILKNISQKNNN